MDKRFTPKSVIRDYQNLPKLKKAIRVKKAAMKRLIREIAVLERRTDWRYAGGVTEIYRGYPLRIYGNQSRESRNSWDSVEVWQAYDVGRDDERKAQAYKLQFNDAKIRQNGGLRYGLSIRWFNEHFDHSILFLTKKDAIQQAKDFVALGKLPPGFKRH